MSLKLQRVPEVQPEVPPKLAFWDLKQNFETGSTPSQTGSALGIHDFELPNKLLETDYNLKRNFETGSTLSKPEVPCKN